MFCNSGGLRSCLTLALCGERWRNTSFIHAWLPGCADTEASLTPITPEPWSPLCEALVRQGSWIYTDSLPQIGELMYLLGAFLYFGVFSILPTSCLRVPPAYKAELCLPIWRLPWTRHSFFPLRLLGHQSIASGWPCGWLLGRVPQRCRGNRRFLELRAMWRWRVS